VVDLIVNADDLGESEETNAQTFELIERGIVSSTTVLTNGHAFEDAVRRIKAVGPPLSVGVHLNAYEFPPVGNGEGLGPLIGPDGAMNGRILDTPVDGSLRAGIAREWIAQVDRLRAQGVEVSHLDSHLHTHTLPALFPALKAVQRHCGVRRVRITKNLYAPSLPPASRTLLLQKAAWNWALRHLYATRTTQAFAEFATFLELARLGCPIPSPTEAMTHPGAALYAEETRELRGDWLRELEGRVRLISYNEL
jgi:predicted glycoside hydrolase/deacetylase ChbG (UPF0249 family)